MDNLDRVFVLLLGPAGKAMNNSETHWRSLPIGLASR
jgi:hypothetical protein